MVDQNILKSLRALYPHEFVIDFMRESHMMKRQIVMLLPYFISIRPDIVKLRSGHVTSRSNRVNRDQKWSGENYMAIEFASFLIEKSKLTEPEITCSSPRRVFKLMLVRWRSADQRATVWKSLKRITLPFELSVKTSWVYIWHVLWNRFRLSYSLETCFQYYYGCHKGTISGNSSALSWHKDV